VHRAAEAQIMRDLLKKLIGSELSNQSVLNRYLARQYEAVSGIDGTDLTLQHSVYSSSLLPSLKPKSSDFRHIMLQ
jgi:hypothetical protein